jgi:hypothetical protein
MRFDSTLRVTSICAALLLTACPADGEGDDTGASDPTVGPDTGSADDDSGSATVSASGQTMSASNSASDSGDTGSDGGPADSEESSGGPVEPQPNGSPCDDNAECESGFCFEVMLLGGVCGECLVDADCPDGGCSLPNPIAMPPVGAVCNDGGPGDGCMTSDVCQDGLVCATILSAPPILEASTCSECIMDSDCEAPMLCSPTYDVLNVSGQKTCVMPGTVPNGEGCDFAGTGDMACMSGLCAAINIMDLLMVGICGDCEVDADCDMAAGEVCLPADVDTTTGVVTPPTCGMPM